MSKRTRDPKFLYRLLMRRYFNGSAPALKLTLEQLRALSRFRAQVASGEFELVEADCLCGSKVGSLVSARDRYGLPIRWIACDTCGIVRQSPRLADESLQRFYNDVYRELYTGSRHATEDFFARQVEHGNAILHVLAPNLPARESRIVLDVGCGSGGTLVPFIADGWSAHGCDWGDEYLELGRRRGLSLVCGPADSLAGVGPADVVILSHVLEHLADPAAAIRQISRMLTSDGLVYIELPGILAISNTYGDPLIYLQNAHLYNFTLSSLTVWMNSCGFSLVAGDEHIRAVFQKSRGTHVRADSSGENPRRVFRTLLTAELYRVLQGRRSGRFLVRATRWAISRSAILSLRG